MRNRRWSPRWIAASASTIVSELINRMNDVTDVNGMLSSLSGVGPFRNCASRPRYRKYVAMNAPKNKLSDDEEHPDRELGVADAGVGLVRVLACARRAPSSDRR